MLAEGANEASRLFGVWQLSWLPCLLSSCPACNFLTQTTCTHVRTGTALLNYCAPRCSPSPYIGHLTIPCQFDTPLFEAVATPAACATSSSLSACVQPTCKKSKTQLKSGGEWKQNCTTCGQWVFAMSCFCNWQAKNCMMRGQAHVSCELVHVHLIPYPR